MIDTASIPLTNRARQYGYLFWPKKADPGIRSLFGDKETIEIVFNGRELGRKRIDWRYRRISVGPRNTRPLPEETTTMTLSVDRTGRLAVTTS